MPSFEGTSADAGGFEDDEYTIDVESLYAAPSSMPTSFPPQVQVEESDDRIEWIDSVFGVEVVSEQSGGTPDPPVTVLDEDEFTIEVPSEQSAPQHPPPPPLGESLSSSPPPAAVSSTSPSVQSPPAESPPRSSEAPEPPPAWLGQPIGPDEDEDEFTIEVPLLTPLGDAPVAPSGPAGPGMPAAGTHSAPAGIGRSDGRSQPIPDENTSEIPRSIRDEETDQSPVGHLDDSMTIDVGHAAAPRKYGMAAPPAVGQRDADSASPPPPSARPMSASGITSTAVLVPLSMSECRAEIKRLCLMHGMKMIEAGATVQVVVRRRVPPDPKKMRILLCCAFLPGAVYWLISKRPKAEPVDLTLEPKGARTLVRAHTSDPLVREQLRKILPQAWS